MPRNWEHTIPATDTACLACLVKNWCNFGCLPSAILQRTHLTSHASISITGLAVSSTLCLSTSAMAGETCLPRKKLSRIRIKGQVLFFLIRGGQACRQCSIVLSKASQVCCVNGGIVISPVPSQRILKEKSFRNPNVKVEKFTALLSGAVASTYSMLLRRPKGFKAQHLF